jgi:L-ribulose-5-phosphate 4-epimerase
MKFAEIRETCLEANRAIVEAGLVLLTWGNVSVADREQGVAAIKPTGVDYETMSPQDMVVVELGTGKRVDGDLKPSVDTLIHMSLYEGFPGVGAVVHTHSHYAVACAQSMQEIPVLGTTHADFFHGPIPVTAVPTDEEIAEGYEILTGKSIIRTLEEKGIDPLETPGALAAYHGPFSWGKDAKHAVQNAIVIEEVARLAVDMGLLQGAKLPGLPRNMLEKHHSRKHGPNAYYGQG